MLVVSRKPRESIRIGDDVTITILRVKGRSVGVGISAPADVPIVRTELAEHAAESEAVGAQSR